MLSRFYLIPLLLHSVGIFLRPSYDLDQMRKQLEGLSLERLCESIAPPTRPEPYLHYIHHQITRDADANATESFASLARSIFMALDICMHIMWTSQLKSYLKKQRAIFASDATLRDALFLKSNSLHSSDFPLSSAGGLPSPKDAPSSPLEPASSVESTGLAAAVSASVAAVPTSLYGSGYVIAAPKLRPSLPLTDSSDEKERKEFAQFKRSWTLVVKHMLKCLGVLSKHSSVGARAVSVGLRRFEEYTRFSFEYTPPAQPLLGKLADASRGNNYVDVVWSKLCSFCSNGREEQAETSSWKLLHPIELITHSGMLVWQYASACVLYSPDDKDARAVPATATSYEWASENTESGDWPRMSVSDNVPLQLYREALAIASFVTEKRKKYDPEEHQTSNRIIGIGHTGSAVAVLAGLLLSERARKSASSRSACVWTYGAASFGSESFWRKVQARTLINLEIVCWRSKADRAFPDPDSLFSPDHCSIRYIDVCPQGPPYISPWILSPSKHYFCLACHHVPVILAKRPKRRGFDLDVIVPDDEEHLLRSAVSLYAPMHTEITVRTTLSADTLEILRNYPDLFPSPDFPLASSNSSTYSSAAAVTPLTQSAAAPTASLSGSTTSVAPAAAPAVPTPAVVTPPVSVPAVSPPFVAPTPPPPASVPPLPLANPPPPPHCPTASHPSLALRVVPSSNLPYVAWRWSPTSRVSWEQLFEGAPPQQTLRYFLDLWLALCALSRHNILIDWHPKVVAVLRWDEAAPDFSVTYEDWLERCFKVL